MQEDLKKKFILLSKFAKEKKYAQEYLGLLARRGDLGSIRIGKRWYTSREWFSEFLADAEKRKEEAARILLKNNAAKISEPIMEVKKETLRQEFFTEEKKNITVAGNVKEYADDHSSLGASGEIKIKVPYRAKQREISSERTLARPMDFLPRRAVSPALPILSGSVSRPDGPVLRLDRPSRSEQPGVFAEKYFSRGVDIKSRIRISSPANLSGKVVPRFADIKISSEKKLNGHWEENINEKPAPEKFLEIRRSDNVFSPSFAQRKWLSDLFPSKLAFGLAAVLVFFLLFQAAVFFKGDLARFAGLDQAQGIVAGASDEKGSGITNVKSEADYYLSSSADAMKESVSFSRLMVRTALERNNGQ